MMPISAEQNQPRPEVAAVFGGHRRMMQTRRFAIGGY